MQPASPGRRRTRQGSAAVLLAVAGMALSALAVAASGAPAPSAPVIHERFTPLDCPDPSNAQTTLEMVGCAQRAVVRADARIDRVAAAIFARLRDTAARRRFVTAQRAWLVYRNADCASIADTFEGGTLASVTRIDCIVERTTQHAKEIRAFDRLLRREG